MIINISESSLYEDTDSLHHDIVLSTYQSHFPYKELYIPNTYVLQDENKNTLNLSIESIVYDSERKSRIIDCINKSRCQF